MDTLQPCTLRSRGFGCVDVLVLCTGHDHVQNQQALAGGSLSRDTIHNLPITNSAMSNADWVSLTVEVEGRFWPAQGEAMLEQRSLARTNRETGKDNSALSMEVRSAQLNNESFIETME